MRDFKYLLTPFNLQEVLVEAEDFVVLSVPHLHFEGPRNVHTKERVLNILLARIAVVVDARESEQEEEMTVGDEFLLSPPPYCDPQERRKRPRESFSNSLTESYHLTRPFTSRDNQVVPQVREDYWALLQLKEFSNTPSSPRIGSARGSSEEQFFKGGITIKEGRETRLPSAPTVSGKDKGKAALGLALALPEVDTSSPRLWRS